MLTHGRAQDIWNGYSKLKKINAKSEGKTLPTVAVAT
jgi:hypothetical protein